MERTENRLLERRFVARWTLATVLGFLVGHIVGYISNYLWAIIGFSYLFGLSYLYGIPITWITYGACVWVGQLRVLRNWRPVPFSWVIASIAGMVIAFCLYGVTWPLINGLGIPTGIISYQIAPVLLAGALAGVAQRWVLRSHVSLSYWWVLVCAVGWAIASLTLGVLGKWLYTVLDHQELIGLIRACVFVPIGGAALGVVTGVSLFRHLRQGNLELPSVPPFSAKRIAATIGRVLLGSVFYLFSIVVCTNVIGGLSGKHPESVGIGLVYTIVFPTTWLGLVICIALIVKFKWLGVILAGVIGALYASVVLIII